MRQAVIVDGKRTPFLKAGSMPDLTALKLGIAPIKSLKILYPGLEKKIDCVVGANIGNQLLPPDGSNIARIIAIEAGIPKHVDARTLNINCGSGLEAVIDAAMRVEVGLAKCVLVIAVEVMSDYTAAYGRPQRQKFAELASVARAKKPMWKKAPALATKAANGRMRKHDPQWLIKLGLTDPMCGLGMDKSADKLAHEFKISRQELDLFALESQRRALAAQQSGKFDAEICPMSFHCSDVPEFAMGKITKDNGMDTFVRAGGTLESLAKLRPLNPGGTTTAGNSSQISDGAVALIVADEEFARSQGWPILARVGSERSAVAGCDTDVMGLGPVAAIKKLFAKKPHERFKRLTAEQREAGPDMRDRHNRSRFVSTNKYFPDLFDVEFVKDINLDTFGVIETNEAFASVVLAQSRLLESEGYGPLPWERTNMNGGAIALGHPVGASGARLALSTAIELKARNEKYALVTLCV